MSVVDTSAIVAVLFGEPGGEDIEAKTGPAGTQSLDELLRKIEIAPVDAELAGEAMV